MSNLITIRNASVDDIDLLTYIGRKAFEESFSKYNTQENMANYLTNAFKATKQKEEFTQPGSLFLIAEENGTAVGYARLLAGTGGETCLKGTNPIELVRIYLLNDWIGKGYGSQLMDSCLEAARKRSHDSVWLGVWEKNDRAIQFYEKWGFNIVGSHLFHLGSDPQTDHIMEKLLW